MKDNEYTNPELIEGVYQNPVNVALLVDYALQNEAIQLGLRPPFGGLPLTAAQQQALRSGGGVTTGIPIDDPSDPPVIEPGGGIHDPVLDVPPGY